MHDTPASRTRRPSPGTVVALLALVVASGGMAYAAIPDAAGAIHSCYSATGALRVIDGDRGEACRASETPLTFNQTGPQGPPGADGADGEDGLDGLDGEDGGGGGNDDHGADDPFEPRGSREAVSAADGPASSVRSRFTAQRSVELPAGRWVITATAVADNSKRAAATFDCRLRAGGRVVDSIDDIPLAANGTARQREAFALTGAARLTGAGAAELQCRSAAPGKVRAASITAISVETIAGDF